MMKCLFLIALTAPILVYSEDTTPTSKPPQFKCYENTTVNLALSAFQAFLRSNIHDTLSTKLNPNMNATVIPAAHDVLETVNDICVKPLNKTITLSYTDFITLFEFSLKDQKYNNFTITGGSLCLNETHSKIQHCVDETVGYANKTANTTANMEMPALRKLLKKSALFYSASTCAQTQSVKVCTEKVLKNSTQHCKTNHVEYVNSLFDFVLQNSPCVNYTTTFKAQNSASSVMFNSAVIMMAFIIALY